jgi:hypothetical protein
VYTTQGTFSRTHISKPLLEPRVALRKPSGVGGAMNAASRQLPTDESWRHHPQHCGPSHRIDGAASLLTGLAVLTHRPHLPDPYPLPIASRCRGYREASVFVEVDFECVEHQCQAGPPIDDHQYFDGGLGAEGRVDVAEGCGGGAAGGELLGRQPRYQRFHRCSRRRGRDRCHRPACWPPPQSEGNPQLVGCRLMFAAQIMFPGSWSAVGHQVLAEWGPGGDRPVGSGCLDR